MSQISKHRLSQQVYKKIFTLFPEFLRSLSRQGKEQTIINNLFSETEKIVLAKRIAIAFMLVKGYTYSQIMGKLKVSFGTVAKISEITKTADSAFKDELQNIATHDQFKEFLDAIGYKIAVMLPPKGGNWSVWRKNLEQEKRAAEQPF